MNERTSLKFVCAFSSNATDYNWQREGNHYLRQRLALRFGRNARAVPFPAQSGRFKQGADHEIYPDHNGRRVQESERQCSYRSIAQNGGGLLRVAQRELSGPQ